MDRAKLRIFPHSQKEFPSAESLTIWLVTALLTRGGVYYLKSAKAVRDLPVGSVVLFRHGESIVGEGVISEGKALFRQKVKGKTFLGEDEEYDAQFTFAPSSIRLYSPPLRIEFLQEHTEKDLLAYARAYVELNWSVYGLVLAEVAS